MRRDCVLSRVRGACVSVVGVRRAVLRISARLRKTPRTSRLPGGGALRLACLHLSSFVSILDVDPLPYVCLFFSLRFSFSACIPPCNRNVNREGVVGTKNSLSSYLLLSSLSTRWGVQTTLSLLLRSFSFIRIWSAPKRSFFSSSKTLCFTVVRKQIELPRCRQCAAHRRFRASRGTRESWLCPSLIARTTTLSVKVARAMAPLPSTRCQRGSRGGGTMKAECRRWKLRTRR